MENRAMREVLCDVDWIEDRTPLPPFVDGLLREGLIQEGSCTVLQGLVSQSHSERGKFPDDTGYEAFVNKFRVECSSPKHAAIAGHGSAHHLAHYLRLHADRACRVILSVDESAAVLRFHVLRDGEQWLAKNLDGYAEPVLVVDYPAFLPYEMQVPQYPGRADIEQMWRAVIAGERSKEEISACVEPIMLAEFSPDFDAMTATALQWLHGFDLVADATDTTALRQGGPGDYLRSISEVNAQLERWLEECEDYDRNPQAFMRARFSQSREASTEHDS